MSWANKAPDLSSGETAKYVIDNPATGNYMTSAGVDYMPIDAGTARVGSIDVFRGLTMFLMLVVNDLNDPDLGNIAGVPAWMRHAPGNVDGMTFVDVIFP